MLRKGLLALGLVSVVACASIGIVLANPSANAVTPVSAPRVQQLQLRNDVRFQSIVPDPDAVAVSKDHAETIALKSIEGQLSQEPLSVQVDYVSWSHPGHGVLDKAVWKVTLVGAPLRLEEASGRNDKSAVQPTSKMAVTLIIVDPRTGEVLSQSSAGPIHD